MHYINVRNRRSAIAPLLLCFGLALALATVPATAQEPQEQQAPPAPNFTDEQMTAFAMAYLEVTAIQQDVQSRLANAATPEEAQKLQANANDQIGRALDHHGWTVEQYNEGMLAVQNHEDFRQRLIAAVNQVQQQQDGGDE